MSILTKIFIAFFSISIFGFLFFVTFITGTITKIEKPFYQKTELGTFQLVKNTKGFFSLSKSISGTGNNLLVEQLNQSDKVIYSSGTIKTIREKGEIIISISKGIYLFDLKEINYKYIIKADGFEINNKGPGIFIVNTQNSRKNIVFTLSSLISLNLKQLKTNKEITSLDLYPHSFLIFNPLKNIFLKNSDLLKVSQIYTLGYFSESIVNEDIVSTKFLNLVTNKKEDSISQIQDIILFLEQEYKDSNKIINNYLDYTFSTVPGEKYINKYKSFFINPNKKTLFYKNIILRNIHKVLSSNKIELESINTIVEKYQLIEKINFNESEEIKKILFYYYKEVIKSNKGGNIKINFSTLINKINNKSTINNKNSLIFLEKTYFNYDFKTSNGFYQNIVQFREKYFEDLKIDITGDNKKKGKIDGMEKIDYFLFFIEKLLLTSNFASGNIKIKNLIILYRDYVEISNAFYSFSDEKAKRTGIFTNSKILNTFLKLLKNKYFEEKRNTSGVLELKTDVIINNKDIIILEKDVNTLFEFYNNNLQILKKSTKKKDQFIIKKYSQLVILYKEYFLALKNYKEYLSIYDKTKAELLLTNTINEQAKNTGLSLAKITKYLNTFNGVNLNYTNIQLMNYGYCQSPTKINEKKELTKAYCYKIDNIYINGKIISFLLHPYNRNKINEIKFNNTYFQTDEEKEKIEKKYRNASYKLDERKELLDKKYKTSNSIDDKEKYDFANFFINTFGSKILTTESEKKNKKKLIIEDSTIRIFKRNQLFGNTGDFSKLKSFLKINYEDVIVKRNDNGYSINIAKSFFNIKLSQNKSYEGIFISKYNFLPNHSFVNPQIKLIDKISQKDLLLGNFIYIKGEYKVNNIQQEILELFEQIGEIKTIVGYINQSLRISNIEIIYLKESKALEFILSFRSSEIKIKLQNELITKITFKNKNLIEKPIKYKNLPTILNTITK